MRPEREGRSLTRLRRFRLLGGMVLGSLVAACEGQPVEPPAEATLSPDALSYLTEALDTMQARSINRDRIDWPAFRPDVLRRAGTAQTYRETYPAIRYAIDGLGDNHSYFVEPAEAATSAAAPPRSPPLAQSVRGRFGYLRVPGFLGSGAVEFAQQLQDMTRALDGDRETCGWIVDLRANTGGDMWPMLLGLGPLVGEGEVGYFVGPDSTWRAWYHQDGEVGIDFRPSGLRLPAPYQLGHPNAPVAVLTGSATVSSGEAIVTAFRGRANTRSFGSDTGGLSTGIFGFRLRDGAQLALAVSVFADRTRAIYGGVIPPDQRVEGAMKDDPADADAVVDAAADWLAQQPSCR